MDFDFTQVPLPATYSAARPGSYQALGRERLQVFGPRDQCDATRLAEIVDREFGDESLELVIGDAPRPSTGRHEEASKYCSPAYGIVACIEDWAWITCRQITLRSLHSVHELVAEAATSCRAVREMTVSTGLSRSNAHGSPLYRP